MVCSLVLIALVTVAAGVVSAGDPKFNLQDIPCCRYDPYQAIVWTGTDSLMTIAEMAAYCGPILWFSPDEPLVEVAPGLGIRMPTAFPFEEIPDAPVVYYRIRNVLTRGGGDASAYTANVNERGESIIDLSRAVGVDLDYFFYYPSEEGFGGHQHDVESTELKLFIWKRSHCTECPYSLIIARVNCKAHGVLWYDNTLKVDQYTKFP